MTVTINHDAIARFSAFQGVENLTAVGERVAARARDLLRERTVVRSGRLLNSIKSEILTDERGPYAKISASAVSDHNDVNYASLIEYGSGGKGVGRLGHPIVPRNARYLSSEGYPEHPNPLREPQISVNHPGNEGVHFLHDAAFQITGQSGDG